MLDALRGGDQRRIHNFALEILLHDFLALLDKAHHAGAFLSGRLLAEVVKDSFRRSTWPRVCSKCSSKPERSFCEDAALAIFGIAFTKRFSASYKSFNSSTYNSIKALCCIAALLLFWQFSRFSRSAGLV